MASALDWLEPVLQARLRAIEAKSAPDDASRRLDFKRVAILQLRAFQVAEPGEAEPTGDALTAPAGPLIGVTHVYSGAALTRNEISLRRFMADLECALAGAG